MTTFSDDPTKAFFQLLTEATSFNGRLVDTREDLAEAISHLPRSMAPPPSELSYADLAFSPFQEEPEHGGPTHGGGHGGGGDSTGTQGIALALDLFKGFGGDLDI
jgi:hypothetical protein